MTILWGKYARTIKIGGWYFIMREGCKEKCFWGIAFPIGKSHLTILVDSRGRVRGAGSFLDRTGYMADWVFSFQGGK